MTEHSAAKNFSLVPPAPGVATMARPRSVPSHQASRGLRRWAMKSLIACQNEPSRGLSSASRLTALSSSSRAAPCAARFVPTGVRKSRILSSAVGSLFASNSDDRARDRKASMHVSRRVLMTMLNAHTPLGVYTAFVTDRAMEAWYHPPLHE